MDNLGYLIIFASAAILLVLCAVCVHFVNAGNPPSGSLGSKEYSPLLNHASAAEA